MSLAFESAQLLLDSRFPSTDDLVLNTLGGTLGPALAFWLAKRADRHGDRRVSLVFESAPQFLDSRFPSANDLGIKTLGGPRGRR